MCVAMAQNSDEKGKKEKRNMFIYRGQVSTENVVLRWW